MMRLRTALALAAMGIVLFPALRVRTPLTARHWAVMLVAFVAPRLGFALICAALILHLRPDVRNR